MASGEPWAPALLLSSSAVLIAYGVSFVLALAERRERLIELIAGGDGQLVPRAGEQLLAPGRRRMLAGSLGRLLDAAASPASPQRATIPRNRSTILACSPELREISEILRADRVASAQPVALCDLLISRAGSPLYRADPECLRQELGRIRYLLTPSASEPSLPERNR